MLSQRQGAEKSNGVTAIPELLRALDLAGCLVTSDAIEQDAIVFKSVALESHKESWYSCNRRVILRTPIAH